MFSSFNLYFEVSTNFFVDPAMPLFVTADADNKLDASDATFVDVFHTNALVQGKIEQCGHVDFYFNGGVYQPVESVNGLGTKFSSKFFIFQGCHTGTIFQCSQ